VAELKSHGIRVSLFIGTEEALIRRAADTGTDRVELYTEPYATQYPSDPEAAVAPFVQAALWAGECGLGLNAGHDLSLLNLQYFATQVPGLLEVSIGHALVSDALWLGMEETIRRYLGQLK
ncbi:MAG: pyridoxine 5'-phosphate synthase, partial [Bacteroidales bacterium]